MQRTAVILTADTRRAVNNAGSGNQRILNDAANCSDSNVDPKPNCQATPKLNRMQGGAPLNYDK